MHKNLRRLLALKGLSVKEVSHRSRIPAKTLYHWLNGQRPRNIQQVYQLCQILEVSLEELFGFSSQATVEGEPPGLGALFEEVHAGRFEVILRPLRGKF